MPIAIYNYESSKIPLLLTLTDSYLERDSSGEYYLDNDWENGPHSLIVFRDPDMEQAAVEPLQKLVHAYRARNPLSQVDIERKAQQYERHQTVLKQLELREQPDVSMRPDATVELRGRKSHAFNSAYHQQTFEHYRCQLNPIYLELMRKYTELDSYHRSHMFVSMYLHITTLYADGGMGYLSFLSHVEGFFSRLRHEGYHVDIKKEFEKRRDLLFGDTPEPVIAESIMPAMSAWKQTWSRIAEEMHDSFDYSHYEDAEMLGLEEQFGIFMDSITPLDNEFHQTIVNNGGMKDLILSREMLVYRDIINLFYLALPLFEQSMVKKQFYAYCAVKYVQEHAESELPFVIK